jgi:NAD(P)-dependent dehydrogenase (short-subunit alcohol dehydrogenase family)
MTSKSLEMPPKTPPSLGLFPKISHQPDGIDLSGQVAIITGANTGLGFHTARHFLGLKLSHLILAVRSRKNGEEAVAKLHKEFPSTQVEVWDLDMSSYESIQSFARRVETDLDRLDITILNSGLAHTKFTICKSTEHDDVIQVNYLSTFLLAILILQALKKKNSPTLSPHRLTIVSPGTALMAKLPNRTERPLLGSFDNLEVQPFDTLERYGASRLLGHLFFVRLLKYLNPEETIVNLVQPGLCKGTELLREAPFTMAAVFSIMKILTALSVEDGAWLYVDAAVVRGKGSHGCFCNEGTIRP